MKAFFKICWIIFCIIISVIYIISALSSFIPPSVFSFINYFAIAFPYIFLLMMVVCFINFFIQKKFALLLLCVLALGFRNIENSFGFNKNLWKNEKDTAAFRIMTWNVEEFVNIMPQEFPQAKTRIQMLHLISQTHPDVLCLQEYWNVENERWLVPVRHELDSLGYHFYFFSNDVVKLLPNKSLQTHCVAIFSRHPFLDSGRINIIDKGSWNENLIYADVELNNKRTRIFTAHLKSFSLYPDTANAYDKNKNIYRKTFDRKHSIAGKLKNIDLIHENEVKIIRGEIDKSPYPVVYCGDMNTTPASYNYQKLKANLQDAFLKKGEGIGSTFYKILPTLRIDYCFADERMEVVQCKVEAQKLSDHYPVITDLKWK